MKKTIALLFLGAFLLSCKEDGSSFKNQSGYLGLRSSSFSPKQRRALFPNRLFIAAVDKKSETTLRKIIEKDSALLLSQNSAEDTPLAAAIKFYNLKGALFLAKQMSLKHFFHQNKKGEGYIYLAAQKGYVELIKYLSLRLYESKKSELVSDYEFSDLDLETNEGERALHAAKNYITAEALEEEYYRGFLEAPFRGFQYFKNHKEQTFLHTAVRNGAPDLLRWGLEHNCSPKQKTETEEEGGSFYEELPVYLYETAANSLSYFWRVFHSWTLPASVVDVINSQDSEGRTAVNFSAQKMFLEGVRILSSCRWTNFLLADNKGNIPLQNFLLALDPLKLKHNQELYQTFSFLMERSTPFTLKVLSDHIDFTNNEGDSGMHIAARLADSYFYNRLKQYGNAELKNSQGQTPRLIFESKRKQLKSLRKRR